jgi:murein DD-endopeptidase MepM/ murein hydrolase activator NlpD
MLSHQRSSLRVLNLLMVALVPAIAVALLTRSGPAHAANSAQLQQQISAGQSRISGLSGTVSAQSKRYGQLGAQAAALQQQIAALQARIAPEVNQLFRLRFELSTARSRLSDLKAVEAEAEAILAQQLVGVYEGDRPDFVTLVLEAKGFQDLLDQLAFEKRVQQQDAQQISIARAARTAVAAQAIRLGALELRQQRLTDQVLAQRNQMFRARIGLVNQQIVVGRARAASARQLAAARSQVSGLEAQLSKIVSAQAAAAAQAAGLPSGGAQVVSSGGFTFPMPKGAASSPGSWSPDQGVDISAPGGTPELAVCSGTIVLHGIGGFGAWAPVLHCDSPVAGYSYVYYGHAGPANELPIGTHVGAGQVIAEVGPGIVGISTGPHLEIGFSDASGTPIGRQTASQMMSLLQAAYAA